MKKLPRKKSAPQSFQNYKRKNPTQREWDNFRNSSGSIYQDIKRQLFEEQGGLCAYCEDKISEISNQRVEHFHPKSDTTPHYNWALDWDNLLGVCFGGEEDSASFSLPDNLSCDASKNHLIQKGLILLACGNELINPYQLTYSASLFDFDPATGKFSPNKKLCKTSAKILLTQQCSTFDLIDKTIGTLNLNCGRLTDKRKKVFEEFKRQMRKGRTSGKKPTAVKKELAQRWFNSYWSSFFTTRRILLGQCAENYLRQINYNG